MRKHITTIIVCTMFAAGLSLLLYPFVSNQWNNYR
ncbi:MAG: class C sortase, partial [Lachnospiraceae bacterium]|nr:class C sortase [Lachnospiraceae bacterium]